MAEAVIVAESSRAPPFSANYFKLDLSRAGDGRVIPRYRQLDADAGVKNVFDTDPPVTNQQTTFQLGFDPSNYDARARFVSGSLRYAFR